LTDGAGFAILNAWFGRLAQPQ